jgi:hypothetical protein
MKEVGLQARAWVARPEGERMPVKMPRETLPSCRLLLLGGLDGKEESTTSGIRSIGSSSRK